MFFPKQSDSKTFFFKSFFANIFFEDYSPELFLQTCSSIFLQKFFCRCFLRRFCSKSFFANVLFSDFSPEVSLPIVFSKIFFPEAYLQMFSADIFSPEISLQIFSWKISHCESKIQPHNPRPKAKSAVQCCSKKQKISLKTRFQHVQK